MPYNFEKDFFYYLNGVRNELAARPLLLGGNSNGSGGPPGGFIGYLPQSKISYDPEEAEEPLDTIPSGALTLINTLNRIRYRIAQLESGVGISGISGIEIQHEDLTLAEGVTVLNIRGSADVIDEGSGKVTIDITASGGGTVSWDDSYWTPLAKPSSPNGMNDEFNDQSFDTGKWTEFDYEGVLTITEDRVGLFFDKSTGASNGACGILQDVPVGTDWSIWTKAGSSGTFDTWGRSGIFLMESDKDHKMLTIGFTAVDGNLNFEMMRWYDYINLTSTDVSRNVNPLTDAFIRVRYSDGYAYADFSLDGVNWHYCGSSMLEFTPTKVGLFVMDNSGTYMKYHFPFFRVTNSSDLYQIAEGNRVNYMINS